MASELFIAFRKQPQAATSVTGVAAIEHCAAGLAGLEGVVAARAFTVNVILGERPPALYPELVICRLDAASFDLGAALRVLDITGRDGNAQRADGLRFAAWEATSVGVRDDFDLPEHLYLQFSANPPSMSFEDYSDWYQVHQDENIAQTDGLLRGWRFRLTPRVIAVDPGPTHLALYEIDGPLERVTGDLGRAMDAGVISLPDWFTRFASLEGVAAGARLGG
jgi:hypothetical protein